MSEEKGYKFMSCYFTVKSQLKATGQCVIGFLHDREYDKDRMQIGKLDGIRRGWSVPNVGEHIEMGSVMAVEAPQCHVVPSFIGKHVLKTKSCKVVRIEEGLDDNVEGGLNVYLELPEDAEWIPNEEFTPPSWNFGDPYEPEESFNRTQLKGIISEYEDMETPEIVLGEIERRKGELDTDIDSERDPIPPPKDVKDFEKNYRSEI